jgi:hypothetical protein
MKNGPSAHIEGNARDEQSSANREEIRGQNDANAARRSSIVAASRAQAPERGSNQRGNFPQRFGSIRPLL